MTPERWQQIKELTNSAISMTSEQRTALLNQSCTEDLTTRLGVEALITFHEQATRKLGGLTTRLTAQLPVTQDVWLQIEQLFQSAMELAPERRAAFLDQACQGDEALRQEVEALVVYQEAAGGAIQAAIHEAAELLALAPTGFLEKSRFAPGALLANRYRVVGQLGKGGMGEVYRADDLKLGQSVALKFLTPQLSNDKAMLARFLGEVRTARQVTHPNVCRVHDIGEIKTDTGTQHFLSMEYIDGEDLSSLLRRIGRLPADKAVEISNQLCAGLAAAHEAGILHRDLKPANVMIDGRGKVRITDFGLAGFAEQIRGEEVFAGTPAYMSPEQFAGKEVTTKSDIYALGLVLYEIFTGKRVFEAGSLQELQRLHESSSPTNPSSWVKDIDPLVERVILRCLEKDPSKRLASAKQVADALPGGDPLAAALALGETPSPEMVAAAGSKTGLRPIAAVACLVAIIIGLIAATHLLSKNRMIDVTPFENSPEVLSQKAREIIARLGYPDRPSDTTHGFDYDRQYLSYLKRQIPATEWRQRLGHDRPAAIFFWHRESPQQILPVKYNRMSTTSAELPDWARNKEDDPPQSPGMVSIRLDMQGRLIRFNAAPPRVEEVQHHPSQLGNADVTDWAGLLTAAGIDSARLTASEPKWTPPSAFDTRMAWTGTFAEQPEMAMRVEAAAWHGRPVYFEVIGPWAEPDQTIVPQGSHYFLFFMTPALLILFFSGGMLAWRNLRQGRSDIQGAFKLAACTALGFAFAGIAGTHALSSLVLETVMTLAVYMAGLIGLVYVALEPYARRRWPQSLISWNRALAGSFRDPLVGRDVLYGIIFGIVCVLVRSPTWGFYFASSDGLLRILSGTRLAASHFVILANYSFGGALLELFLILLLRTVARRDWLAISLYVLINAVAYSNGQWQSIFLAGLIFSLYALMLTRFGLLTVASAYFVIFGLLNFPVTLNFSAWYAGTGLTALLAILALAVFAFYTSLGGQKVFAGKLLEE